MKTEHWKTEHSRIDIYCFNMFHSPTEAVWDPCEPIRILVLGDSNVGKYVKLILYSHTHKINQIMHCNTYHLTTNVERGYWKHLEACPEVYTTA